MPVSPTKARDKSSGLICNGRLPFPFFPSQQPFFRLSLAILFLPHCTKTLSATNSMQKEDSWLSPSGGLGNDDSFIRDSAIDATGRQEQAGSSPHSVTMGLSRHPSPNPPHNALSSYGTLPIHHHDIPDPSTAQAVAPTEICALLDSHTSTLISDYNTASSNNDTSETDHLLGSTSKWSEASLSPVVVEGIETTWQEEARVLTKSAVPLVVTLCLQYSLTLASVFSAGNLGRDELAACSLASMSANITGFAVYNGKDFLSLF